MQHIDCTRTVSKQEPGGFEHVSRFEVSGCDTNASSFGAGTSALTSKKGAPMHLSMGFWLSMGLSSQYRRYMISTNNNFIDLYRFISIYQYEYNIYYIIYQSQMMKECPQLSCHSCVKSSWCCSWWLKTFTLHKWSELGHRIQRPSFISGPRLQKAMNNSTHYTGAIFIWLHPAQRKWNTCCTSVDISWIRGSWATYLGCGSETFSLSFGIVFGL